MKKLILTLFILGIVVAACGVGLGVLVKDNQEIRQLSAQSGIAIAPENADQLIQLDNGRLSGIPSMLLRAYPLTDKLITYGSALAAASLVLLILSLLIKPVITIICMLVLAAVLYLGYQGNMGPDVQNVVRQIVGFISQAWQWLRDLIRANPVKLPL